MVDCRQPFDPDSQRKPRVDQARYRLDYLQGKHHRASHAWPPYFIADFNHRFAKRAHEPKHSTNQTYVKTKEIRKLSKSTTFQYDKVVYLIDPTEANSRLAKEHVKLAI